MSDWTLETPAETGRSRTVFGRAGRKDELEGEAMGKRARKKKDRRKNKANHGKRPNS